MYKLLSAAPVLALTFFSVGALAAPCAESDLRQLPVGSECATSAGVSFKLVARTEAPAAYEVWQDLESSLLWGDRSEMVMDQTQAFSWCASEISLDFRGGIEDREWTLPSRTDFETAEAHGFREVLPNMRLRLVWTSTTYASNDHFAYVFSGSLGTSTSVDVRENGDAYWGNPQVMARCIAR